MKALPIKKQIEVLKLALEIYNDVERREKTSEISGIYTGMCSCIRTAVNELLPIETVRYDDIPFLIPCFNFSELKEAGINGLVPLMRESVCKDGFWWSEYDFSIRPIVFQYLIDSYKK